jgi:hypothetical protein
MQQIFKSLFPELPDSSRVWLYLANRKLVDSEEQVLNEKLGPFLKNWAAHGKSLQCNATTIFSQYLIFVVDENIESASGCSIDSSVHFVKAIGSELRIDFFTRSEVLVVEGTQTHLLSYGAAVEQKKPFINPMITSLHELRQLEF